MLILNRDHDLAVLSETYKQETENEDKKGTVKINHEMREKIVGELIVSKFDIAFVNQDFYQYNNGIWSFIGSEEIKIGIYKVYEQLFQTIISVKRCETVIKRVITYSQESYGDVEKNKVTNLYKEEIRYKDYIIDLKTNTKREYVKEDFCFSKLDYNYIEFDFESFNSTRFCSFLFEVMGLFEEGGEKTVGILEDFSKDDSGEVMDFLQEWFGYTLVAGNPLEKALILYGDGRNGKSKLMEIWKHVIGSHNCAEVGLQGLIDNTVIEETENKFVNFCTDSPNDDVSLDHEVLKKIISNEPLMLNAKYKKPRKIQTSFKLIIGCNDVPYVKNNGKSISDRYFILPFLQYFSDARKDPFIVSKMKTEAEIILSWARLGYERIMKNKHFTVPERCKKMWSKYKYDNDSIEQWIDEKCNMDNNYSVFSRSLWESYRNYCDFSKKKAKGRNKFYDALLMKGYRKFKDRDDNTMFTGLELKK